eukprot:scaffold7909_cov239-Pinguiococcus_pyrenoidosus.AAC.1
MDGLWRSPTPSSSLRSVESRRVWTEFADADKLRGAPMASMLSKTSMQGALFRARANTCRRRSSESPRYLEKSVSQRASMTGTATEPRRHSIRKDLPTPEGPYSRMPDAMGSLLIS